ncbi:FkbM family methyltransferase [Tolypothrix sp. FACHB-123]|uniref:FkbM family methyltransferase n=1 Tax=Tolypothrix sp. FACHB-123 TaxID=2692868 RepID=UPI001682B3CD|nr:FkbM family methyltransferase [Tolypothrix sp. FACHB-123]MBD2358437.1 FkbM family methyltransferase [Tolypothrix sp. FACHB-123]
MNFSNISNKNLLGQLLRFPLKVIPPATIMPILQGKLRGKKWIVGSGQHGSWLGSYEYDKQILFQQIVTQRSVIYDIGAHTGFYALLASVLVGANGKVVAFEPDPRNLFYLKKHLQLNQIQNVTVIEAAVSDSCGKMFFEGSTFLGQLPSQGNIESSFLGRLSSQGNIQVKTVAIDELINKEQIPIPNFLKIDVEGAELLVLSGAKQTLSKAHPTILLATHGAKVHQQCCEFLKSLDYKLEAINGGSIQESCELIAYFNN